MNEVLHSCPMCQSTALKTCPVPGHWIGENCFLPEKDSLGLSKCRSCSFVFVNPRPSTEALNSFYSSDTYECHDPDFSPSKTGVAEYMFGVLKHFNADGRVLDFGCGGGFFLSFLRDQGWSAVGYDVGQAALQTCREQDLDVVSDLSNLEDASLSAIVMSHVVEHLEAPGEILQQVKRLLAPDGKLFIATPNATSLRCRLSPRLFSRYLNFDERYRAFPIHLSYFSIHTLPLLLKNHGFSVEAVLTHGMGLEELVQIRNSPSKAATTEISTQPRQRKDGSAAKSLIKRLFFESGLGENVMVVGGLECEKQPPRPLRYVNLEPRPSP